MRQKFICAILLVLLTGCKSDFPDPAIKARQNTHALCGGDKDCFQRSYPSFYQTEVQKDAAKRSAFLKNWQSIRSSSPSHTDCETMGSTTSCTSY